jgi:hypothetical protein
MSAFIIILVFVILLAAAKWFYEIKYKSSSIISTAVDKVTGGASKFFGGNWDNEETESTTVGDPSRMNSSAALGGSVRVNNIPIRTGGRLNVVPIS